VTGTERNIRLLLAYDGTNFHGWQRQIDGQPTIQATLEEKIALMVGHPIVLHGAGRTDAGVHALGMVANFRTTAAIPCDGFVKGLNSMLPCDIRVLQAGEVPESFHARFSATAKTYFYQMYFGDLLLPTRRLYWARFRGIPDLGAMREALRLLEGEHDFSSFEASGSREEDSPRGPIRRIFHTRLITTDQHGEVCFEIRGDGFLRHMVRNIAGTLVEVALGKKDAEGFCFVLQARDRSLAGPTAPARGLFLKEVDYRENS